jgi:hypothetical protein
MIVETKVVNDSFIGSNIASSCTKRLRECAHQNIHIGRINSEEVAHTTTIFAKSANAVSFVNIKIKLFEKRLVI